MHYISYVCPFLFWFIFICRDLLATLRSSKCPVKFLLPMYLGISQILVSVPGPTSSLLLALRVGLKAKFLVHLRCSCEYISAKS